MTRRRYVGLCLLLLTLGLSGLVTAAGATDNPPAPGFDAAGSDERAIEIADEVMESLGGRQAWDRTRFLTWNFFGNRRHFWDKHSGDVRVEGADRESGVPYLVLMNLQSKEGRAWRDGVEASGEDLAALLELGESAWINDAYWMFMPYKLKDSGVTLRYVGEGQMTDGRPAEVLQLTFSGVGRTPQNKYRVYVAESGLVEQWDYYENATDEEPRFQVPWADWEPHGEILLSGNRGRGAHTDIAVFDSLPRSVFTDPAPVDLEGLGLGSD